MRLPGKHCEMCAQEENILLGDKFLFHDMCSANRSSFIFLKGDCKSLDRSGRGLLDPSLWNRALLVYQEHIENTISQSI